MNDVTPPNLPLPAPHAMRKGRAVRVRLLTPRQRKRLIIALAAVTVVALCVVFR